jgi:hypothetical protein
MDQPEQPTTIEGPAQGHEAIRSDRSRSRRLVAVAAGTTIALGAGGIAYAATTSPTPATSSSSTPSEAMPDQEDQDGGEFHGPGGFVGHGDFGVLHGEMVVETEDGTYETVATQRGTIDEITDDSVTVTSEDGYTRTYVIDSTQLETDRGPTADPADLAVGDEVMVMAKVDGSTATVRHILDLANLPERPMPGGPGWRGHGDGPPAAGSETVPDTAPSTATS